MNNSLLEGKKPPVVPLKTRGTIFRVLSPPYFKEGAGVVRKNKMNNFLAGVISPPYFKEGLPTEGWVRGGLI
jgi:hypothetical protein